VLAKKNALACDWFTIHSVLASWPQAPLYGLTQRLVLVSHRGQR
jgi:hypothetical protein